MDIDVSDDIKAVIDWEIAHNGNSIEGVYRPFGPPVVAMTRPVKRQRDVAATLKWWEFRDGHYAESEWCAGFESTASGHKVCGPIG
jgi:hypothetical protein